MTTHTPGPWNVDAGDDGYGIRVYQQRCRPELDGAQLLIAALDPGCDWIAVPVTELAHNARLIAAAPDLLAALEIVSNCIPDSTCGTTLGTWEMQKVREAIRKAKGE